MEKNMRLSLVLNTPKEEVGSFSRGHITVHGSQKNISSIGQLKDQSMMIFLSIVHLLDGIRHLSESNQNFEFVGVGSSFQFVAKIKNELIYIEDFNGELVGKMKLDEFVASLWKEVEQFITINTSFLSEQEVIYSDLQDSLCQFKEKFNL